MEIIKHGKTYKAPKEMTCPDCGCVFTYKDTDIEQNWVRVTAYDSDLTYTYIVCPECRKTIIIKDFRK
jgi:transcription initiation factor TFIIIB Brf1 subunit/transcription initiation factor TFIIB